MLYISEKHLSPHQKGVHVIKIRNEYLNLKFWFDHIANKDQKKLFVKYCKEFILCGRPQHTKMIELAEEIKTLTGSCCNVVTEYAIKHSSKNFLEIRSVANLTFLRVFFQTKAYKRWLDPRKSSYEKGMMLEISINIDNILLWSSIAQKRVTELKDEEIQDLRDAIKNFEDNITNAIKRNKIGVTQNHKSEELYIETIAPVLGDGVPVLVDYFGNNPNYGRLHVINPTMKGPFNLTWLIKFALHPLIEVLDGAKPLSLEKHEIRAQFVGGRW